MYLLIIIVLIIIIFGYYISNSYREHFTSDNSNALVTNCINKTNDKTRCQTDLILQKCLMENSDLNNYEACQQCNYPVSGIPCQCYFTNKTNLVNELETNPENLFKYNENAIGKNISNDKINNDKLDIYGATINNKKCNGLYPFKYGVHDLCCQQKSDSLQDCIDIQPNNVCSPEQKLHVKYPGIDNKLLTINKCQPGSCPADYSQIENTKLCCQDSDSDPNTIATCLKNANNPYDIKSHICHLDKAFDYQNPDILFGNKIVIPKCINPKILTGKCDCLNGIYTDKISMIELPLPLTAILIEPSCQITVKIIKMDLLRKNSPYKINTKSTLTKCPHYIKEGQIIRHMGKSDLNKNIMNKALYYIEDGAFTITNWNTNYKIPDEEAILLSNSHLSKEKCQQLCKDKNHQACVYKKCRDSKNKCYGGNSLIKDETNHPRCQIFSKSLITNNNESSDE